ncbi:MAG TPA: BNR-4 repeat-containing protein, partial [Micropepsaceae bacterium]
MTADYFSSDGATYPNYDNIGPCAFYDAADNKTWDCREAWNGSHRQITVTVFDHGAGNITDYTVSTNTLTNDDHGEGALCMDHEGYVHLYWGAHLSPLHHAVTTNPRDPTAWTIRPNITTTHPGAGGVSYPHPCQVGSVQYLLLRDTLSGTHKPCCLFYTTSLSGGVETWSSRIDIADYGLGSDGLGTWFYSSLMYVA